MKDYTEQNPVFSDTIQITETSDPAHADNINAAPMQLLQNTMANREEIEELKKGNNEVEFDDTGTGSGTDIPGGGEDPGELSDPADAIEQITSGKSVPTLIGHIKTALKGLLSLSESIIGKIPGLAGMVAGGYSADKAYAAGEYCTHEECMYKFTGSKEAGEWDPDSVRKVTVAEELAMQGVALQGLVESIGNPDAYDPQCLYMAGDFCIQNNQMYKRNADMAEDTELPHPWDETEWTATSIAEEIRQLNVNMTGFIDTSNEILHVTGIKTGKTHTWTATENAWIIIRANAIASSTEEAQINFYLQIDGVKILSGYLYANANAQSGLSYEEQIWMSPFPIKKGQEVTLTVVKTTNGRSCSITAYGMY